MHLILFILETTLIVVLYSASLTFWNASNTCSCFLSYPFSIRKRVSLLASERAFTNQHFSFGEARENTEQDKT